VSGSVGCSAKGCFSSTAAVCAAKCPTRNSCAECTADSQCGWCATDQKCHAVSDKGNVCGCSSSCGKVKQISPGVSNTRCPAAPCGSYKNCTQCTQDLGCGWSAPVLPQGATPGHAGFCTEAGPFGLRCDPSSSGFFSYVDCAYDCLALPNCTMCNSDNRCQWAQGCVSTSDGYRSSKCLLKSKLDAITCQRSVASVARCGQSCDAAPLANNCSACVSTPGCGWCGTCTAGNANGPYDPDVCSRVPSVPWSSAVSECSAPPRTVAAQCAIQATCAECMATKGCGYCYDTLTCVPGDKGGPSGGSCARWGPPGSTEDQCNTNVQPCPGYTCCKGALTAQPVPGTPGCGFCNNQYGEASPIASNPALGSATIATCASGNWMFGASALTASTTCAAQTPSYLCSFSNTVGPPGGSPNGSPLSPVAIAFTVIAVVGATGGGVALAVRFGLFKKLGHALRSRHGGGVELRTQLLD